MLSYIIILAAKCVVMSSLFSICISILFIIYQEIPHRDRYFNVLFNLDTIFHEGLCSYWCFNWLIYYLVVVKCPSMVLSAYFVTIHTYIYYNTDRLWHGTINTIASITDIHFTLISEDRFKPQIKLLYLEHIRSFPNECTVRSTRCGTTDGINAAHLWYCIWFMFGLQCNLLRSIWNSCWYVQINGYNV